MTYNLRRLRLHGLIERTPDLPPQGNRLGLRSDLVLTRVHNRFLTTVMADAGPHQRAPRRCDAPSTTSPPKSTVSPKPYK